MWRIGQLERTVEGLERKVDRLTWALVTLSITISGSAIVFAFTVLSLR